VVEIVVEWPSNVSGRNLVKCILVVVVDQPQECRFFLPLMFFTNVVLASFEFSFKMIYISNYSKYNY
jgi:hypothetical protein